MTTTTAPTAIATINPKDLHDRRQRGEPVALIDVRSPAEHRTVHATGAALHPLDALDPKRVVAEHSPDAPLYVICHSGQRARTACQRFIDAGYTNVVCVEGGTKAWEQAGLPVERGRATMSLERQVRIAAGALVLTGAVLALTVNPWWALLSGFVGAGLVFAGVTDTCGMAMLLAKMPWNR